ncbi:MAG TPA: rhomboid family intramembrane serine protease [Thermoanaerobaculia bacterium]|nr:rhomboid family intramembrane serine protease [Thermoanaerobaculia bacterium]
MIPLRQTLPTRLTPVVNRSLVAVNVLVFGLEFYAGRRAEVLIHIFGFIPKRLIEPEAFRYQTWEALLTLATSLFLHGGVVHLLGNLIYLRVFGGAIEDLLGHARYLLFFIACGVVGSLTHAILFPQSIIPSIGASGSIAGILGAFLVLRPRARIVTLFPLVIYWAMAEVRAVVFLPVWFGMQFLNGFLSLTPARGTQEVAGVAWWAHVGGFVFGAMVGTFVRARRARIALES